jgi:hypothetical protein
MIVCLEFLLVFHFDVRRSAGRVGLWLLVQDYYIMMLAWHAKTFRILYMFLYHGYWCFTVITFYGHVTDFICSSIDLYDCVYRFLCMVPWIQISNVDSTTDFYDSVHRFRWSNKDRYP